VINSSTITHHHSKFTQSPSLSHHCYQTRPPITMTNQILHLPFTQPADYPSQKPQTILCHQAVFPNHRLKSTYPSTVAIIELKSLCSNSKQASHRCNKKQKRSCTLCAAATSSAAHSPESHPLPSRYCLPAAPRHLLAAPCPALHHASHAGVNQHSHSRAAPQLPADPRCTQQLRSRRRHAQPSYSRAAQSLHRCLSLSWSQ
jgi:hypothetical protein